MKPGLKTAVLFTALLAGTAITGAQEQDPWQEQGAVPFRETPQFRPSKNAPRQQGQHPRHRHSGQQSPRGQHVQQRRTGGPPPILKWKPTPEQQENMKQQYQKILTLFDLNGDGQISEQERKIVQKGWQKQQRRKRAEKILQKDEARGGE